MGSSARLPRSPFQSDGLEIVIKGPYFDRSTDALADFGVFGRGGQAASDVAAFRKMRDLVAMGISEYRIAGASGCYTRSQSPKIIAGSVNSC